MPSAPASSSGSGRAVVKTSPMPWLRDTTSDRKTARLLERNRFTGLPIGWDAIVGHDHAKRELRVGAVRAAGINGTGR